MGKLQYSPPEVQVLGNIADMLAADSGMYPDNIVPLTSSQPGG